MGNIHAAFHEWMRIGGALLLLGAFVCGKAWGQDRIYLKNGDFLFGTIVEEIPPISLLRLQLPDSNFVVLDLNEVYQIFRGPVQAGYWDKVTLKEGAEIFGYISFYQAGREIRMEIPGSKKEQAAFGYLEIDKIEKIPVEDAEGARQNKRLLRDREREERIPRSMRYLGEYGITFWGEHAVFRWNLSTQQMLLFDFSSRYALGMGMGFDFNPNAGSDAILSGNSVIAANRFYFPGNKGTPYLLTDLGYDFIRDGFLMNTGAGIRIPAGKKHINFNLGLRLQQTDILGNARNSLSTPDPPRLLEMLQLRFVLE